MSEMQLVKVRDSLDFTLGEIAREARKQARQAQLKGDRDLQKRILGGLEKAENDHREAERRLMVASLSTKQVEALIRDLDDETNQAHKLLDNLRKGKETLENLKKAAELASAILATVAKIVG